MTWRERWSVGFDETIAQLDQIFQTERQRKERPLTLLRAVVMGLDGDSHPPEPGDGDVVVSQRRATAPLGTPYVPIPKRTTHGGRYGPAVIAKFRARALAR
jgi:hypothetical protein